MHLYPYDIECLQQAKELIERDISVHISIDRIATTIGLSKSKLKLAFKQYYGIGIYSYLRNLRMEKAMEMIEADNIPAKYIALRCGFKYHKNFIKSFHAYHGMTPGAAIKMNRLKYAANQQDTNYSRALFYKKSAGK